MLHDAANGVELQPRTFDVLGSLRLDIGAEPTKNFHVQRRVRVAEHGFARRDGDFGAGGDRQHAMTHGAVTLRSVLASPRDHRDRQTGQKIRVTPQYAKTAARVFRAQRFYAVFPAEQILVLIYDDFRRDNEAFLRVVLRFLEVDDTRSIEVLDTNPSVRVRSQQLDDLVHAVSVGRGPVTVAAKRAIKALAPRDLRRELLELTRRRIVLSEPPAPDERLMLELRRRFKGEVVALSEYLDRDLVSLWGYDSVD